MQELTNTLDSINSSRFNALLEKTAPEHRWLIAYAAFPVALTSDLLFKIWVNFRAHQKHSDVVSTPVSLVPQILLSPVCKEISRDVYEIFPAIRAGLLTYIRQHPEWGMVKIEELARFLSAYVTQCRSRIPSTAFAEALRWTADAYLKPERAAESLLKAISDGAINGWPCARIHYFISWAQQLGFNASDEVMAEGGRAANPLLTALRLAEGVELFNADRRSESIERFKSLRHLLEPPKEISGKCFQTHIPKMVWDVLELESEKDVLEKELDSYAIVVGFRENYPRKKEEINAESNAKAFYEWLISKAGGALTQERVKLYTTPQRTNYFIDVLDSMCDSIALHRQSDKRSRIYLYFAGHGGVKITDAYELVLTLNHGQDDRRDFFLMPYAKKFKDKGFDEVLIFFDCLEMLYEPQPFTRVIRNFISHWPERNYLLAASIPVSGLTQRSGLDDGCSLFTSTLIKALNGEAADNNGHVTESSLLQYVSLRVYSSKFLISEQDFVIVSDITNPAVCDVEILFPAEAIGTTASISSLNFRAQVTVAESLSWKLKLRDSIYYVCRIPELRLTKGFSIKPLVSDYTIDLRWQTESKFILVLNSDAIVSDPVEQILNTEIGEMLAQNDYGLVNGGWGITQAYLYYYQSTHSYHAPRLVQFLGNSFSHVIEDATVIITGDDIWNDELAKNIFAIIMIGGNGSSLDIFTRAINSQIPVIPIACSGGDATTAYFDMLKNSNPPYRQHLESMPLQISTQHEANKVAAQVQQILEFIENRKGRENWRLYALHVSRDYELSRKLFEQLNILSGSGHVSNINLINLERKSFQRVPDRKVIILLLLSSNYLASRAFVPQLEWLYKMHLENAIIMPVILGPCPWDRIGFLSNLTALPANGVPVTNWQNADEAILHIVNGIRHAIDLRNIDLNALSPNRILIAEKLTATDPGKIEIVHGLQNLEEVFGHYKPQLTVKYQFKGETTEEIFRFNTMQGFSVADMGARSEVLKSLRNAHEQFNAIHTVLINERELRESLYFADNRRHVLDVLGRLLYFMTWNTANDSGRPVILFFGGAAELADMRKRFNPGDVDFIVVSEENQDISAQDMTNRLDRVVIAHFASESRSWYTVAYALKLLSKACNLKLILFSAPIDKDKVDVFLKEGVRTVVAPTVSVTSAMIADFFVAFYKELAWSNSISRAFGVVKAKTESQYKKFKYSFFDKISPWAIYFGGHSADQLMPVKNFDLYRILSSGSHSADKKLIDVVFMPLFKKRDGEKPATEEEVRSLIYKWCDLMHYDVEDMLSICEDEVRSCKKKMEQYLAYIFENTRELERAYRNIALFFANISPGNNNNISFVNYHPSKASAKNEARRTAIAEEFARNYDTLDLRRAYSLFVLPLRENDLSSLHLWADIAHEHKLLLITDYPRGDNPDQIVQGLKAVRYRRDEVFSNVIMTCNKLVGRRKNVELGEKEDMLLCASFALAGAIYMAPVNNPDLRIDNIPIEGASEAQFTLTPLKWTQLRQVALIPIDKVDEKIACTAFITFYLGNCSALQYYPVVRLLDFISKAIVDILNRRQFEIFNAVVQKELNHQIITFLDKCSAPGWLAKHIVQFEATDNRNILHIALQIGSFDVLIAITRLTSDSTWHISYQDINRAS